MGIHINTDIWTSVDEVDAFVSKSMKELVDGGMTDVNCLNANREQLCAVRVNAVDQIHRAPGQCAEHVRRADAAGRAGAPRGSIIRVEPSGQPRSESRAGRGRDAPADARGRA